MDYDLALVLEDVNRRLEEASLSIGAPFGAWNADKYQHDVMKRLGRTLAMTTSRLVGISDENQVFKMAYNAMTTGNVLINSNAKTTTAARELEHELQMMNMAGDCSVAQLGRIYDKSGTLCGFIMSLEISLVPPRAPNEAATLSPDLYSSEARKQVIQELCALVDRLHARGVMHGDIKPANLLRCSDGGLRFCDFECATVIGQNVMHTPTRFTERYASPRLNKAEQEPGPFSFADDLYSTGMSIWEIYTGQIPFEDVENVVICDVVAAGVRPDISKVDDVEIAELVVSYLDRGCGEDPALMGGKIQPAQETCIVAHIAFEDCRADVCHTYSTVLHSASCRSGADELCAEIFTAPGLSKVVGAQRSCAICGVVN